MGLEGRLSVIGVQPEDLDKAINNLYHDSVLDMAMVYSSEYVAAESLEMKKNPGTISSIPYIKSLI